MVQRRVWSPSAVIFPAPAFRTRNLHFRHRHSAHRSDPHTEIHPQDDSLRLRVQILLLPRTLDTLRALSGVEVPVLVLARMQTLENSLSCRLYCLIDLIFRMKHDKLCCFLI